ncbi:MAG: hypothetical protein H0T89_34570 [Deltaproteobacteria bacterium]|nr:hypothetical protein [Deltaproteobacteria bacterium]MDQ3296010.1 hypothetical protein [Myxococcota bacterium]
MAEPLKWLIAIVVSVGCNSSGPSKAAPRSEPTPAERAALVGVLPATPDLPRPLAAVRFGMTREEALAAAPALAREPSVIHEMPIAGTTDGTLAVRFSGSRVEEVSVSLPDKELRTVVTELWGPPFQTNWWLNPAGRIRAQLAYSSTLSLRPYLPLRELLGTADKLGIEPLVGQRVDDVRTRFATAFREETAAEMAESVERILRHAPPGIDPAVLTARGPSRSLFLPPTELARADSSTVVDLSVRDNVVEGFVLHLRYADDAQRAELERLMVEAWGPHPPARLKRRDIRTEEQWVIAVGTVE